MSGEHLRVLRGAPTPEELAVLTAVLAAVARRPAAAPPAARGRWNDPATLLRTSWPAPRAGAWRASAW